MFNDVSGFNRIFIACGYPDLCRGIDGLAAAIKNGFHMDLYEQGNMEHLMPTASQNCIKALAYEGAGVVLAYKRLANGRFQRPRNGTEVKSITSQQYRWLMDGLAIEQKKTIKKVTPRLI